MFALLYFVPLHPGNSTPSPHRKKLGPFISILSLTNKFYRFEDQEDTGFTTPTVREIALFRYCREIRGKHCLPSFHQSRRLSSKEFRQQKISLPEYTAVIFTARTAIDHFFTLCESLRVTIPETMKYFCTTEAIALYLQKYTVYRKRKIFFGNTGKLDDLIPSLNKHNSEKFLLPVSDVNNGEYPLLDKHKINYTKAVMYRTVSNDFGSGRAVRLRYAHLFQPGRNTIVAKKFPRLRTGRHKDRYFRPDNRQSRSRRRLAPRLRSSAARSSVDDGGTGIVPQRAKQSGQEITIQSHRFLHLAISFPFRNAW